MSATESLKWLRSATFVKGCASTPLPPASGPEVAFAGRSNVGKSSVLNRLCDNRRLARTSRTPGRTREINFFALPAAPAPTPASTSAPDPTPPPAAAEGEGVPNLVDLPGYGYARMPQKLNPSDLLSSYLRQRQATTGLVLIVDIRRSLEGMGDEDAELISICRQRDLPLLLLLNKADKLNRNKAQTAVRNLHNRGLQALAFSAQVGTGLTELADWVGGRLRATP